MADRVQFCSQWNSFATAALLILPHDLGLHYDPARNASRPRNYFRPGLTQCLAVVVQAVAAEMGNRTAQQVQHYYRDNMQARKKGAWSSDEDAALLKVPCFSLPRLPHAAC